MLATAPLPLNHSWPIFEASTRLALPDLGAFGMDAPASPLSIGPVDELLAARGIGLWECDLTANDRLSWSAGTYDLFGLQRGEPVERALAVSLYCPDSRLAMQQLRTYAIRHRRGFTVDAEIRRPGGDHIWMRLSAVPVIEDRKVARLRGMKVDVTREYDSI